MIGHYTINITEIFQVFEWFSVFDSNAPRAGAEGFLKGWIFPKGGHSSAVINRTF